MRDGRTWYVLFEHQEYGSLTDMVNTASEVYVACQHLEYDKSQNFGISVNTSRGLG